jgi:cell division protein FtsB
MALGYVEERLAKAKMAGPGPPEPSPPTPPAVRFFSIPEDIVGIDVLRRQIEELQQQLEKLRDERSRLVDEAGWLRRENELLEKQAAALREENDRLERTREDLESRSRRLQQIVAEAEQANLELKKSAAEWQERNQELQKSIEPLQKKNAELAGSLKKQLERMRLLHMWLGETRRENQGLREFVATRVDGLIAAAGNLQRPPELAALLAMLAYRFAPFDPDDPARPSVYNALWSALNRLDEKAARELIAPAGDRANKLWTTRSELMVQRICQRVSRGLSKVEWQQFLPPGAPYTPASSRPCSGK